MGHHCDLFARPVKGLRALLWRWRANGCARARPEYSARRSLSSDGEMAEWLKAHAWNACRLVRVSWVRIPLSPPALNSLILCDKDAACAAGWARKLLAARRETAIHRVEPISVTSDQLNPNLARYFFSRSASLVDDFASREAAKRRRPASLRERDDRHVATTSASCT